MAGYTKVGWPELAGIGYGTSRVYSGPLGCRHLAFVINRQPPGVSAQYHSHAVADEIYVLFSGRGIVEVEGDILELAPLEAIRISAGLGHVNRNPSTDTEAVWLVMGAPLEEYEAEEPHLYGPAAAFPQVTPQPR
jgi:mannose-6-phosphate isomerase-like protein (cupin superfamily)